LHRLSAPSSFFLLCIVLYAEKVGRLAYVPAEILQQIDSGPSVPPSGGTACPSRCTVYTVADWTAWTGLLYVACSSSSSSARALFITVSGQDLHLAAFSTLLLFKRKRCSTAVQCACNRSSFRADISSLCEHTKHLTIFDKKCVSRSGTLH